MRRRATPLVNTPNRVLLTTRLDEVVQCPLREWTIILERKTATSALTDLYTAKLDCANCWSFLVHNSYFMLSPISSVYRCHIIYFLSLLVAIQFGKWEQIKHENSRVQFGNACTMTANGQQAQVNRTLISTNQFCPYRSFALIIHHHPDWIWFAFECVH